MEHPLLTRIVTVALLTEHTDGVFETKLTVRPELAVALMLKGAAICLVTQLAK